MIESTISLSPTTQGGSAVLSPIAAPGGFAQSLDALRHAGPRASDLSPATAGTRQNVAGRGKAVPQDDDDADTDDGTALIWLPMPLAALPIAEPVESSITDARPPGVGVVAAGLPTADDRLAPPIAARPTSDIAATQAQGADPARSAEFVLPPPAPTPPPVAMLLSPQIAPAGPTTSALATSPVPASAAPFPAVLGAGPVTVSQEAKAASRAELNGALPAGVSSPDTPVPQVAEALPEAATTFTRHSPMPGLIQPARQAFAAALAGFVASRRPRGPVGEERASTPMPVAAPVATGSVVAAGTAADHAPLDLRRDRDLAQMVDHIESLRDDADAHDTRIRLTPDILGTVDIAVRRHGDALHVHFSAERDATRALLAETRPRLTEMAEARGIRIASASINGGGVGGGDRQPQPQSDFAQRAPIAAPARAAIDAADGVGARDLVKPLAGQRLA